MKNYFKHSQVKPGRSDFAFCSELLSRIDDLAPSDASVTAIISRMADGMYHTLIPVRASDARFADGSFYAEARTKSLISSVKQAQTEMLAKLKEWKASRF